MRGMRRSAKHDSNAVGIENLYGQWMRRVADEWPASCAHNLTKPGIGVEPTRRLKGA